MQHTRRPAAAQRGFTLVDLILAILIVAVLSALALPRVINLGADARRAKAEGLYAALRSAAQIVRGGALVAGQTAATGSVPLEGGVITTNFGYPTADSAGIIAAAGLNAGDDKLTVSAGAATPGSLLTIQVQGADAAATCQISYTSPGASGEAAAISLVTTGC